MEEEWVVPKISAPLDCLELALISRMPCSKGVIICKALAFFLIFSHDHVYSTTYLMKKRGKNRQCILKSKNGHWNKCFIFQNARFLWAL
jgi:hypothetical protein